METTYTLKRISTVEKSSVINLIWMKQYHGGIYRLDR